MVHRGASRADPQTRAAALLRLMSREFDPRTVDELCQLLHPNHVAWIGMGASGDRCWSRLGRKVVRILRKLQLDGDVWRVGHDLWNVSSQVEPGMAERYFEWLEVMCDEYKGSSDSSARRHALSCLSWFLSDVQLGSRPLKETRAYEQAVISCVRALVLGANEEAKERQSLVAAWVGVELLIEKRSRSMDRPTCRKLKEQLALLGKTISSLPNEIEDGTAVVEG